MITVNGRILERRDTTANWNYVNPVLPVGQLGWEYSSVNHPVGVKMGDGVTPWDSLPYWFTSANAVVTPEKIHIAATTSSPFAINMTINRVDTGAPRSQFGDAPTVIVKTAPGFPIGGTGTESAQVYADIRFFTTNSDESGLTTIKIISPDGATFANDYYIWLKI